MNFTENLFLNQQIHTMKIIIGLFGKKGSGKDTFADYMVEKYGFQKVSFAEPLKKICKELFLLSDDQINVPELKETVLPNWNLSPRQILQKVGTDLFRQHFSKTFWTDLMKNRLEQFSENEKIIITDIRFQNEHNLVQNFPNSFIIKIQRDERDKINDSHISENWDLNTNIVIDNNGSKEDFFEKIEKILQENNILSSIL